MDTSNQQLVIPPDTAASVAGRPSVMQQAHSKLPLNQLGLPVFFFRPDFLPMDRDNNLDDIYEADTHSHDITDAEWDAAAIEISYAEGYPTIEAGTPLWERMDFEPLDAYGMFKQYLQQLKDGTGLRSLHSLAQSQTQPNTNTVQKPKRVYVSLQLIELNEMFYRYYWPQRVQAFDMFERVVLDKLREHRAITLDDTHFSHATKMLDLAMSYIDAEEDSDFDGAMADDMSGKMALELAKVGMSVQRISSGLPAAAPRSEGRHGNQGRAVEVHVKQGIMHNEEANKTTHMRDKILGSEEMTVMAQELVIRMENTDG